MNFAKTRRMISLSVVLVMGWHSSLRAENVVERVEFASDDGQAKLVGTLSFQRSVDPQPAVVLISSLGPPKLRRFVFNRPPLRSLEQHLVRQGIAVLWFDDRGTGESTGDAETSTIKKLAEDVGAAIKFLKRHQGIDSERIGLIGHSDGGLSAAMVAADRNDVGFVVLISPAGTTGHTMVMRQLMRNARSAGVSKESLGPVRTFASQVLRRVQRTPEGEDADLQAVRPASFITTAGPKEIKWARETVALCQALDSAWMRDFLALDAAALLNKVPCPMLITYGGDDQHFPGDGNTTAAKEAIKASAQHEQSVMVLPGLNHNLQSPTTPNDTDDRTPQPMDPKAIEVIHGWVSARTLNASNPQGCR